MARPCGLGDPLLDPLAQQREATKHSIPQLLGLLFIRTQPERDAKRIIVEQKRKVDAFHFSTMGVRNLIRL